jgi:hypothetical protein
MEFYYVSGPVSTVGMQTMKLGYSDASGRAGYMSAITAATDNNTIVAVEYHNITQLIYPGILASSSDIDMTDIYRASISPGGGRARLENPEARDILGSYHVEVRPTHHDP